MSTYHFLRSFKTAHGVTPWHYLNRKRVQAAIRLIQSTDWSLTDIAEHVGFGSRTTLFRRLKTHASIPVAELRREKSVSVRS
jgi:transcriptional regulator GlxA family with amidase domain